MQIPALTWGIQSVPQEPKPWLTSFFCRFTFLLLKELYQPNDCFCCGFTLNLHLAEYRADSFGFGPLPALAEKFYWQQEYLQRETLCSCGISAIVQDFQLGRNIYQMDYLLLLYICHSWKDFLSKVENPPADDLPLMDSILLYWFLLSRKHSIP